MNSVQPAGAPEGCVVQVSQRAFLRPRPVLIFNNGESLLPVEPICDNPEQVQAWLAKLRANLIADGMLGESPARWLTVFTAPCMNEFLDHAWQLRYVLVDEDSVPTFVYRKLPVDMLGLGSLGSDVAYTVSEGVNLWNASRLREMFDLKCFCAGTTPAQALENALGLTANTTVDEFWLRVTWHLQRRRIRLIFSSENIASEVRKLVEFLNNDMKSVEILAAEVR